MTSSEKYWRELVAEVDRNARHEILSVDELVVMVGDVAAEELGGRHFALTIRARRAVDAYMMDRP